MKKSLLIHPSILFHRDDWRDDVGHVLRDNAEGIAAPAGSEVRVIKQSSDGAHAFVRVLTSKKSESVGTLGWVSTRSLKPKGKN